jgi:lipid II:glycine glycyltransferase (peptidoglycan interpeptide bridge formation enzyme)
MSITVRAWDDPASWNQFIASVPYPHFQQSWEWGELAPELGGSTVRLAATEDGEIRGAMQLFVNQVKPLRSTILYVPRGPALAEKSARLLGPLLDAARRVGLDHRSIGIRLEPGLPKCSEGIGNLLRDFDFHPSFPPSQPRSSWVLDICPDEDELLATMKQKTRYNIRLALRRGVTVSEAGQADFDEFYELYRVTAYRDDFFVHPKQVYARMFDLFRSAGVFSMLFARKEGVLIAAITLVRVGNTCWYLHGASSNEHRNVMATYLLQWEGIRCAKEWGCRVYDFRAVPDILREDQDMYGVYRFKEGFGGHQLTTMDTFAQPYRPGLFALWQSRFSGRFAIDSWQRARAGQPARQFA